MSKRSQKLNRVVHSSKSNYIPLGGKITAYRPSLFGACSLSIYKSRNETTEKASTTNRPTDFKAIVPLISSSESVKQEEKSSH